MMSLVSLSKSLLLSVLLLLAAQLHAADTPARPNVLFIAIDDLNGAGLGGLAFLGAFVAFFLALFPAGNGAFLVLLAGIVLFGDFFGDRLLGLDQVFGTNRANFVLIDMLLGHGSNRLQDFGSGWLFRSFWLRLQAGRRDRLEVLHVARHDGAARLSGARGAC